MSTVTYDDVRHQAEQLSLDERVELLEYLQGDLLEQLSQMPDQKTGMLIYWIRQMVRHLEKTHKLSAADSLITLLASSSENDAPLPFWASQRPVTREALLAESEQLRAEGAFKNVESLRDKYANPLLELSDEDLRDSIQQFGQEWEQDFDNLLSTD